MLDAKSAQGTIGKITFGENPAGNMVPNSQTKTLSGATKGQPLVKEPKKVNVAYFVVDPIEQLAISILEQRDYVVFKKHCGPAVIHRGPVETKKEA